MRLVPKPSTQTETESPRPRLYFVHIPKTAGITLKAFLENNYAHGESLVVDEWRAREMNQEQLRQYRLLSGHYSSEVLDALGERPDMTLLLVREPVSRFRSWIAHCRRLSGDHYQEIKETPSDRDALGGSRGYTCTQAYWLARALRDGASSTRVPEAVELSALLNRVDIPGVTDEIERFMQLVSFRMEWPVPQLGWHINRRPEAQSGQPAPSDMDDRDVRDHLSIDIALYEQAATRFWSAYTDMLSAIRPDAVAFTPESAKLVPIELAQDWLRHHYEATLMRRYDAAVDRVDVSAAEPLAGEGWWWRECPNDTAYRWTGPDTAATLLAPPLTADASYILNLDAMGAADWDAWETVGLEINGRPVVAVHEQFEPRVAGSGAVRLWARIDPSVVAAQKGLTRVTLHLPGTRRALAHVRVEESFDTYHNDMRAVGLAVHRLRIQRTAAQVTPQLTLRRTAA